MKNFIGLFLFITMATGQSAKFHVIRQWKYINFTWPDESTFKTSVARGAYIPENNIIAGVKYHDDYFYLTLPRMKNGVPATLARIRAGASQDAAPDLEPFPSWEMNGMDDCNFLQNVQNVEVDAKGQIWIIDGGRTNTLLNPVMACAPKLVVYDIGAKSSVIVYVFPEQVVSKENSFLYDIVVDDTDGGYAYITDNSAHDPGIIVYSVRDNRSWKIRHSPSMSADPSAHHFTVNDVSISTPINIAGIALGPRLHTSNDKVVINDVREVYFCPLSSLNLFSVNTTILRNEDLVLKGYDYGKAIKNVGVKPSQSVGMIMDNQGVLYYGLLANNAVGRWDSHTPFEEQRLIARDDKYIEWPNSFTLDQNGNLTVVVNRLNKFIFDKLDLGVYNFRLISAHVGGRSYLYDNDFSYESHNDDRMVTTEPVSSSSSTTAPSSSSEGSPGPSMEKSQQNVTTAMPHIDSKVNITESGSSQLLIGWFWVILSAILFSV